MKAILTNTPVDSWAKQRVCPMCSSDKIVSVGKPYNLADKTIRQSVMCDGCSNWVGHETYILDTIVGWGNRFEEEKEENLPERIWECTDCAHSWRGFGTPGVDGCPNCGSKNVQTFTLEKP